MAKPKTELGQRCPPPPYTRWDQRGKPVLLSYLKLINGKQLCLSLETDDPEIAKGHMRLLVAMTFPGANDWRFFTIIIDEIARQTQAWGRLFHSPR